MTIGAEGTKRQGKLHNLPATSLNPETTTAPSSWREIPRRWCPGVSLCTSVWLWGEHLKTCALVGQNKLLSLSSSATHSSKYAGVSSFLCSSSTPVLKAHPTVQCLHGTWTISPWNKSRSLMAGILLCFLMPVEGQSPQREILAPVSVPSYANRCISRSVQSRVSLHVWNVHFPNWSALFC